MILILLILIPLLAGILALLNTRLTRWTCLTALVADFILLLFSNRQVDLQWIPQLGISFKLSMDGLSFLLVMLTIFLGIMSVAASWNSIRTKVGFFHLNLMFILAGIIGVFLAMDLFLFYFFWELMLVPMYFLISIWGHENRTYAAIKFFLFTQLSGLFMLAAIITLYFIHGKNTGEYTFDYFKLLSTSITPTTARWLMAGFLIAFVVKLPVVPFHTWLPDAHTEAPTAGSVILAGLLLKTGAYGIIRFAIPLFPTAAKDFTPYAYIFAIIGIIYGAVMAYSQTDLKRLIAYTSISHMGFALLGIFAQTPLALQGAVIVILAHGVTTGALFILVGELQDRTGTREMPRMGGLWQTVPKLSAITLFFALASLGLPGMGNFVGEFLVLLGSFRTTPITTILASTGFIFSVIYSLYMIQQTFQGPQKQIYKIPDLSPRELIIMACLIAATLWLGLYPNLFLNIAAGAKP